MSPNRWYTVRDVYGLAVCKIPNAEKPCSNLYIVLGSLSKHGPFFQKDWGNSCFNGSEPRAIGHERAHKEFVRISELLLALVLQGDDREVEVAQYNVP